MSAARAIAAAMDPVMSAAGFANAQFGQVGWTPESEALFQPIADDAAPTS